MERTLLKQNSSGTYRGVSFVVRVLEGPDGGYIARFSTGPSQGWTGLPKRYEGASEAFSAATLSAQNAIAGSVAGK